MLKQHLKENIQMDQNKDNGIFCIKMIKLVEVIIIKMEKNKEDEQKFMKILIYIHSTFWMKENICKGKNQDNEK
ncbi:unnamed protein product [Paramecium pentaurelia]|uniref:Uncharacterized protein n=1 Tax=Paramecium pentaurelia TaxID=43138 RepID=A0A8S1URN8_9CILI|nr:unnamed protein product [Paramecium pentaurelia]